MDCLANSKKGERCKNSAKFWNFGFCGKDHNFYNSKWHYLGRNQWIKYFIYPITFVLTAILVFEIEQKWELFKKSYTQADISKITETKQRSLFQKSDSIFNILILPFEDRIGNIDVNCIGYSIYTHLDNVKTNKRLPINPTYFDSTNAPRTLEEAESFQKYHNSDLVIFGLAQNVEPQCNGAEVCFRYSLREKIRNSIIPQNNYNLDFVSTTPFAIQEGNLSLELNYITFWISALALRKFGDNKSAIQSLNQLEETTSLTNEDILELKFKCYTSLSDTVNLKKTTEKRLKFDQKNSTAYLDLGWVYANSIKDIKRGIKYYTLGLEIDSLNSQLYYVRGDAKKMSGDIDEAILDYNTGLKLSPFHNHMLDSRANAFMIQKKYRSAIHDLERSIRISPKNLMNTSNLGDCYLGLGQPEKAIEYYDRVLNKSPKAQMTLRSKARVLETLNKPKEAIDLLEKAILGSPIDFLIHRDIAILNIQLNNKKDALMHFELCFQKNNKITDCKKWIEKLKINGG